MASPSRPGGRDNVALIKLKLQEQVNNVRGQALLDALYPRHDRKSEFGTFSLLKSQSVPGLHSILDDEATNKPMTKSGSIMDLRLAKHYLAKKEQASGQPEPMKQYFGSLADVDYDGLSAKLDREGRLFPDEEEFYLYHNDMTKDLEDDKRRAREIAEFEATSSRLPLTSRFMAFTFNV